MRVIRSLMGPALQKDLHRIRTGEDRQPFHNGAGQEMGIVRLLDHIAGSPMGFLRQLKDAGASRAAFPRWSVGTIKFSFDL